MKKNYLEYVMQFLSDNKRGLFHEIVENRTRYATVVLEDLHQPHNASAVMRTCDCFGIQDVHLIENQNTWTSSRDVERGSSKWINIYRHNKPGLNNTVHCMQTLKEKGYKLVATTPHTDMTTENLPLNEPVALIFGTEKRGVSDDVLKNSDYHIKIPMCGFTESFNISVAAAICMHTIREKLNQSQIDWKLSENEKIDIMLQWCSKTIDQYDRYEKVFQERLKA